MQNHKQLIFFPREVNKIYINNKLHTHPKVAPSLNAFQASSQIPPSITHYTYIIEGNIRESTINYRAH